MSEIWKPQPPKIHRLWVESVIFEGSGKLNSWETNFLESIERQLDMRIPLTQNQEEKLESIYSNNTN